MSEARAVERGLQHGAKEHHFEVLRTGMGLRAARRALEKELGERRFGRGLNTEPMPDFIISTGYAGTLDVGMAPGSWVLGDHVLLWINPPSPAVNTISPGGGRALSLLRPVAEALGAFGTTTVLSSPLLVAYDPALNRALPQRQGPVAVDMESAALADVARRFNIPFAVLRLVTDTPEQPLPRFVYGFANALSQDSRLSMASRALHAAQGAVDVARKPQDLFRFVQTSMGWGKTLESGWRRIAEGSPR